MITKLESAATKIMRIIPIIVFLLFLLGCGGTYMREGEMHVLDLENERFSFLSSGETTKDEVLSQLGKPTTTFENETILVYRLIIFKEHRRGSMCWDSREILALPDLRVLALDSQVREWAPGCHACSQRAMPVYGLILVFDKGNIVEEHRIFRPRINITDCGYEG